jgi:hypothetical protein
MGRTRIPALEGAAFEAWMAKEHPGIDYNKTYASMQSYIRSQWKEYQRQIALDKVRAVEYKDKWLTAKEFDKQTADNKLRGERYSTVKTFADRHKIKIKLNPDYKHGDQWGKYTSGKYLYEPVTPELVKKTKKSVLKGKGSWTGPIFEEEWQRRKDLGQKLIDESRKTPDKKKWIITQRDLNKALTKLTHPITGEKEIGFSDEVLGKGRGNLYPELTGKGWQKDPIYLEKNPRSMKTDAVFYRIRKRILKRISGPQTEKVLPAIKGGTPFSDAVHILHTTSKGGQEYLTIEDLALGSKKQNLTYATRGPDGLDTLRNKMEVFLRRLGVNHGHKGVDGEIKLNPRTVKQWNLPKSTWKFGELAERFNLALSDMAMATDGLVRGNLLDLKTLEMTKNPFKGNMGQLIGAGTLGDITVKELDASLGKLELQTINPETGKSVSPQVRYLPQGDLKFKNKFYLRDAAGKLLTNPDGSIKWALDPAKVTQTDLGRIHSIVANMRESLPQAAEGKPLSLSGLATKTQNPLFLDLARRAIRLAKTNDGGICDISSIVTEKAGGGRIGFAAGSSCARQMEVAFNKNPVKVTQEISALPANKTINSLKTAAGGFLKMLGRGGVKAAPYAALAAVGAGIEPLVKQFRIDDPTTYLTDESQMKGMLLATIEGETPKVDEEILKWQYPGMAAATAAGAIPGAGAVYKARQGLPPTKDFIGPMKKGVGKTRAALGIKGVLGKALGASFSPLATLATLPVHVAAQRAGGADYGDIATDPTNWMGPAFASTGAEMATRGMKSGSRIANAIRLGFSPRTLSMFTRRFGLPGLAVSAGLWGYDKWKNRSINDPDE